MRTNLLWQRLSALSGVVASVLIIAGITVGDINSIISVNAGSDSIARAFVEHRDNILIGTYLTLLGVFFFLVFLAYLRGVLLESAGDRSWLPSVAFGGGLVSCAMLLLAAHFSQAFTVVSNYRGETQVAKALYILEWNSNLLVEAPALAALVGATTAVGFVFKAFPLWLNGWGALLTLVLLGPFLPGSGVMVTFMWLAVLSILLFVRTRKADA
jgi:hypothetical protein